MTVGQPVRVRMLLQNTSDHVIGGRDPSILPEFSIQGPSGQQLPRKELIWAGSSGIWAIRPGEVSEGVFHVDDYYDLSQPGKYTLQLKRPIAEDHSDKDGFVSSNVITVTVSSEAAKRSAPLELTLTGPSTFVSGSDVSLNVSAKNIADQDVFLVTDPDGSVANGNCGTHNVVNPPNGFQFGQNLAHAGPKIIRTISPGATLETKLDKKAMGFSAVWTLPRTYSFQLICSLPGYPDDLAASNILTLNVTQPPAGGPTPFTLKLSGPKTVVAGSAIRVDLEETDTSSDFGVGAGLIGQLNPLAHIFDTLGYSLSVRDPSGHELPLNIHANIVPRAGSVKSIETGPCNSYAVLSDFYDMSQPGTYRVQVSRYDWTLGGGRVFSNVLTINVTPAAQQ